jgi:PhzF family phenazine biosynthesis protein
VTHRHPLYIVDAFTDRAFHGNPAAVCLLRKPYDKGRLQEIAAEMNLAETAFLRAPDDDMFAADEFELRWFTPTKEVPLCGHATLATAKVLYDELGLSSPTLTFRTLSGPLVASHRGRVIDLDFPRSDPTPIAGLSGLESVVGREAPLEVLAVAARRVLLLRMRDVATVRGLAPDFGRMRAELSQFGVVIATAQGEPPYDFTSRCFAPVEGIDEDPATGMAHTVLAPYWAGKIGGARFQCYQASARGGEVEVELIGKDRVRLSGGARLVLRGYLDLPD